MRRSESYLKVYLLCIFVVSLILCSTAALGAIINVPGDEPTIQAGIDAAFDYDTVLVADGTYTGDGNKNLNFAGKAITVQSENGPENCIIDCEGAGQGFVFWNGEGKDSVVSGFTIENSQEFSAVHCDDNSSPTITNCIITGNGGIGIFAGDNSSPTITDCTIKDNSGGGIGCYFSSPIIRNCMIAGNTADYGGGISCSNSSPTITGCTITGNTSAQTGAIHGAENSFLTITDCTIAGNSGGGINLYNSSATITNSTIPDNTGNGIYLYFSSATITNCTIAGNSQRGISCSNSSPSITNCAITGNTTEWGGAGIACNNSSPTITNSIISNNMADYDGAGIRCLNNSSPTLTNCTISNNTASRDGGGIYCSDSFPTLTNCILWADSPDEIFVGPGGNPVVTYSDIQGGFPSEGNIDDEPLFVGGGDYHLTHGSPCIDAGTDEVELPYTDKDGLPRIVGSAVDIGAYEYQGDAPDLSGRCKAFYFRQFGKRIGMWIQVRNDGYEKADRFNVAFYLSDGVTPSPEGLIKTAIIARGLKPGRTRLVSCRYVSEVSVSGKYLSAAIDSGNEVVEMDETNNLVRIRIP